MQQDTIVCDKVANDMRQDNQIKFERIQQFLISYQNGMDMVVSHIQRGEFPLIQTQKVAYDMLIMVIDIIIQTQTYETKVVSWGEDEAETDLSLSSQAYLDISNTAMELHNLIKSPAFKSIRDYVLNRYISFIANVQPPIELLNKMANERLKYVYYPEEPGSSAQPIP